MSIFDIPYQLADLDAEIKRVSEEHAETVEQLQFMVQRLQNTDQYETFSQYQSDYDDAMTYADLEEDYRKRHNKLVEEYNTLAERMNA
ncbi:DENND11 family protein [Staphylococcus warneri]|uniref:DENND11 family protein n=1 Tax=Staphylococcus warneri TaxID=1292 RepID=A0ABS9NJC4_STAWA|nr:hypothetical protein [Staphylococcus warneri]MCG6210333.1 DENND11 family protein [Staphylococcus warneri]MCG6226758.1 DENND11 family protein [Staphylococcus warneri]MCG6247485.1 DENND11 family protein [Staphylococcus warneri]MCG6249850.1 DENND11 family protein [Staphylococcus warneri]MCG6252220.1 DENND11 family protein [Staphylococcus warneri]